MTVEPLHPVPSKVARSSGSPQEAQKTLTVAMWRLVQARGSNIQTLAAATSVPRTVLHRIFHPAGIVLPWEHYVALLHFLRVEPSRMQELRQLWLMAGRHAALPAEPHHAVRATDSDEIRARTPAEFAGLLNQLLNRSGAGKTEIAKRSGIARSQIYELIKPGRTALPTKPQQVTAFASACGLGNEQVTRLLSVWEYLTEQARQGIPAFEIERTAPRSTSDHETVTALADQVMDRVIKVVTVSTPAQPHANRLLLNAGRWLLAVVAVLALIGGVTPDSPIRTVVVAIDAGLIATTLVLGITALVARPARLAIRSVRDAAITWHRRWYCWRQR